MLNILYFLTYIILVPTWGLLIVAPRGNLTQTLIRSNVSIILFGGMYFFVLVGALVSQIGQGPFSIDSTERLGVLMSSPAAGLVVWLHFMVVDLAAAIWITEEAEKTEMSGVLLRGLLVLTLFLAPLGVMVFVLWRSLRTAARRAGLVSSRSIIPQ